MTYNTLEIAKFVLADVKRAKRQKAEAEADLRAALYDGPLVKSNLRGVELGKKQ